MTVKSWAVKTAFRILPTSLLLPLAKSCKRMYLLPQAGGRDFRFDQYLGEYTIHADPGYPIEHEMLSGRYDLESLAVIHRFVKSGAYCLDVGANVGALSMAMAQRAGASGKVFAFEPGPLIKRLIKNVSSNASIKNVVQPVNMGLADAPGRLFWSEDQGNRGNASLTDQANAHSVEVATLDQYAAEHLADVTHIDFVKIDVEGMELAVIKGGMETWKKFHPVLYFETDARFAQFKSNYTEIAKLLTGLGYGMHTLEGDTLVSVEDFPRQNNTIAIFKGA